MKITTGKATLGLMMLLSAGFLITLLVSADNQQPFAITMRRARCRSSVGLA